MPVQRRDLLAALAPFTKALRAAEETAAQRAGLTMWQYAVLASVSEAPELNQGEVAARLGYSANRIIADLDVLERRRLIIRTPAPDRRANLLKTTAAGVRLMRKVQADIHRREDELLATMPERQRRVLRSAASSIVAALRTPSREIEE